MAVSGRLVYTNHTPTLYIYMVISHYHFFVFIMNSCLGHVLFMTSQTIDLMVFALFRNKFVWVIFYYYNVLSNVAIYISRIDQEMLETEAGNLSAVTRIQHIADDILIKESGKLVFLIELLDRLRVEGHRCLVFSQSRKMLDIMQKVIGNRVSTFLFSI